MRVLLIIHSILKVEQNKIILGSFNFYCSESDSSVLGIVFTKFYTAILCKQISNMFVNVI